MENQSVYEGAQERHVITQALPEFAANLSYPENEFACLNDKYITSLASRYEHLVVQILNLKTLEIVYASPNVEKVSGFTPQESMHGGVFKWMSELPEKELLFQLQNNQFVASKLAERKEDRALVQSFLLNGEITHKNGEKMKILSSNFTLDWTEEGEQQHHLFLWIDATHIFKTKNTFWRHLFGKEQPCIWSYDPEQKEFQNNDLFCGRGREIIFLLSQGKSNEQIGELLHINAAEVNDNIKKMARRLQVKNADGLLEIARWIRLI
jgi:DNA-binding CsgD family transcriptional regulator